MAYATLQDLKDYLGVDEDTEDALLSDCLVWATSAIDEYCDQVFEATGDTTRYFDAIADVTKGYVLHLDYPLAQITSVTSNADATSGTVLATGEYITLPRNETPYYGLKILASSGKVWEYSNDPEAGIEVVGRWAYSVTPPVMVQRACRRLAAFYYRQKDSQVFETTAIPEAGVITTPIGFPTDVKMMLAPFVRR